LESDHIKGKKALQDMQKQQFEEFVSQFMFSETEKAILFDIYDKKLYMWEIGNKYGYSESGIRKIHAKLLKRIIKYL
jgi:DNA-directed RNA polymerase specialized sigma subunit